MCYDVTSGLKALIKYAKHRSEDPAYIEALEKKLELWQKEIKGHHYVSGFSHPSLLVFTGDNPFEPQAYYWGLIPHWVKDPDQAKKMADHTLNAKCETMFEKPSFRDAARNKRCLVYIDAFYEFHHAYSKTYPFHIADKNGDPLCFAGLWDEWVNHESGEIIRTVSLVTTKANQVMARIHNNPKLEEPRMPVILKKKDTEKWLRKYSRDEVEDAILELCKPYDASELSYHTVRKLKGKDGTGDTSLAEEEFHYDELNLLALIH